MPFSLMNPEHSEGNLSRRVHLCQVSEESNYYLKVLIATESPDSTLALSHDA